MPAATSEVLRISVDDVARFGREIDNVRAALDWSFSRTGDAAIGVTLTAAFAPVWLHLLLVVECRERAERVLNILSTDFNLVAPLGRAAHCAWPRAHAHNGTGGKDQDGFGQSAPTRGKR